MFLTNQDKGILLLAARQSIYSLFIDTKPTIVEFKYYPNLRNNAGAFTALYNNNDLRGCVGYIQTDKSLYDTVCDSAKRSATEDQRFVPIQWEEIPFLNIEISVIYKVKPLLNYEEFEIGRHGLYLEHPEHVSILLPQIAKDNPMNIVQMLMTLCERGGLEPLAFQQQRLNIKYFECEIFSEVGKRKRTIEQIYN